MANNDFISGLLSVKSVINSCALVALPVLLGLSIWLSYFWLWLLLGLVSVAWLLINSLVIIMPGYAGYIIVLGKMMNMSLPAGLRLVWPFISSVTPVDIRLKNHSDTNVMKTKDLREISLTYALTYQVDAKLVHLVHSTIGENEYMNTALCPWLDATCTEVIASKTYEEINQNLKDVGDEIRAEYVSAVERRCVRIAGENMFKNVSVAIIDVKFDEEYTKAVSELARVTKENEIVKVKAEQLLISAEAKKKADITKAEAEAQSIRIKAEAEAEALKIKGASENEIRDKLGEILASHPELIKEVLAKNFPKVYGAGANTFIDIDKMLGD